MCVLFSITHTRPRASVAIPVGVTISGSAATRSITSRASAAIGGTTGAADPLATSPRNAAATAELSRDREDAKTRRPPRRKDKTGRRLYLSFILIFPSRPLRALRVFAVAFGLAHLMPLFAQG